MPCTHNPAGWRGSPKICILLVDDNGFIVVGTACGGEKTHAQVRDPSPQIIRAAGHPAVTQAERSR